VAQGKGRSNGNPHSKKRPIDQYEHKGKKRVNNPPVGLVNPETDPPLPTHKVYGYGFLATSRMTSVLSPDVQMWASSPCSLY